MEHNKLRVLMVCLFLGFCSFACESESDDDPPVDAGSGDTDTDTDTDSDTDTDTDSDTDTDTDSDADADTDSDTDADTDSDTDTDTDTSACTAPVGVEDWGNRCHVQVNYCSDESWCIILDFIHPIRGYCAAECCNPFTPDPEYCPDISDGTEFCGYQRMGSDGKMRYYCVIRCETDDQCPENLVCDGEDSQGEKICYPANPRHR